MARGTTLAVLVDQLRAEIGHSTDASVGQEKLPQLQQVIRRNQAWLYQEADWPFLRKRDGDKTLAIGQRYYDFPSSINPDRVESVTTKWGNQWIPVTFGIDNIVHYNTVNSDDGETNDPVEHWDWYVDDAGTLQFEVWPMPATAGTIRFCGIRNLSALVADADTADLDDVLIVLLSAAELRSGKDDEKAKRDLLNGHLRRLKANGSKSGPVVIGGGIKSRPVRRPVTIRIAGA